MYDTHGYAHKSMPQTLYEEAAHLVCHTEIGKAVDHGKEVEVQDEALAPTSAAGG